MTGAGGTCGFLGNADCTATVEYEDDDGVGPWKFTIPHLPETTGTDYYICYKRTGGSYHIVPVDGALSMTIVSQGNTDAFPTLDTVAVGSLKAGESVDFTVSVANFAGLSMADTISFVQDTGES